MWSVWRTVLEENEKLARARLAAVEVFQQQIADDAKILRAHKLQSARKVNTVQSPKFSLQNIVLILVCRSTCGGTKRSAIVRSRCG